MRHNNLYNAAHDGDIKKLKNILINNPTWVDVLIPCKGTPLHAAAESNQLECLDFLISSGARVNVLDHTISLPLHRAILCDSIDCVNALLKAGSVVNVTNSDGYTPLGLAVRIGRTHIIDILKEYPAAEQPPDEEIPSFHKLGLYFNPLCYEAYIAPTVTEYIMSVDKSTNKLFKTRKSCFFT